MASRIARGRDEANADQVELKAIRDGFAPFLTGLADDMIAGTLSDDYDSGDIEAKPWQQEAAELDDGISGTAAVVQLRKGVLGDRYPFTIERNRIRYNRRPDHFAYEFLLATAASSAELAAAEFQDYAVAFERLTGAAVRDFFRADEWCRIGWPTRGDRPTPFREVALALHEATGEFLWNAHPDLDANPGPQTVKDGGIDVVAWKRFTDRRVGNMIVLAQCACGNNWASKCNDLDPGILEKKYFRPLTFVDPIRCMAIPYHADAGRFRDAEVGKAGILFDRLRLTLHLDLPVWANPQIGDVDGKELVRRIVPTFGD